MNTIGMRVRAWTGDHVDQRGTVVRIYGLYHIVIRWDGDGESVYPRSDVQWEVTP